MTRSRSFFPSMTAVLLTVLFLGTGSNLLAQSVLQGEWEGYIDVQGNQLQVEMQISAPGDTTFRGLMDIPQQMASDIPLQGFSVSGDSVQFGFFAGTGMARFEGVFENNDRISGQFHQGGMQFPFQLERTPEEPAEPLPYGEEELEIMNGEIRIAGTLTIPEEEGPHPAVVLLTGSGAQNRNEEIFGFELFRVIADHLTRNGIAVFRYDDRGVGESTGSLNDASLDDLKGDLEAVIDNLSGHEAVDAERIGAMGHSQGGIIGGAVAGEAGNPLDFLVLMASPAQSLSETIFQQIETALGEQGAPDSTIQEQIELQQAVFDTLRGSGDFVEIRQILIQNLMEQYGNLSDSTQIANTRQMVRQQVDTQLGALKSPAFSTFMDHDPGDILSQLDIPVLVLFGGKDQQIAEEPHRRLTEEALDSSGTSFEVEVFPEANHLFQDAETGSPTEYGSLDEAFVEGFLERVTRWIRSQTSTE